jgi:hypothetical protein
MLFDHDDVDCYDNPPYREPLYSPCCGASMGEHDEFCPNCNERVVARTEEEMCKLPKWARKAV